MTADDLRQAAYQEYQAGNVAKAAELCGRVLALQANNAEAVYLLGVIAHDQGQMEQAAQRFAQAAALSPDNAVFLNALGEALFTLGKVDEAEANFRNAISARPAYERAHNNLGRLLHSKGENAAARASFAEAIRLNPNYPTAQNNLGAVLQAMGEVDEAMVHFRKAISLRPGYPEAHFNLGSAMLSLGDPTSAVQQLQEAIRLRPNYVRAHTSLGQALMNMGQVTASETPFRTAVRLAPDDPAAYAQLGDVLVLLRKRDEAMEVLNQALRVKPDDVSSFAHRFRLKNEICDWKDREAELGRLWSDAQSEMEAGRASSVSPVHAMSLPWPASRQLLIARSHARAYEQTAARAAKGGREPFSAQHRFSPEIRPFQERVPDPLLSERVNIAYLSRDFYDHPVGHQMQSLFGLHDRQKFEVHAYSFGPDDGSTYRRRIERDCERFHDVAGCSVAELDRRIRADGIQILIDLMGYTGLSRTACVALRPAPIQVSWLGYSGTTGANFIDYIIGDPQVTPLENAEHFSERIVQLPHSFMVTDDQQPIAESAGTRAEHKLPDDAIVFCCFNNAYKIDPELFSVWMRVLHGTPGSILWLSVQAPAARANLRREAEARGINGDRLIFAEHLRSKAEHLARYRLADLFLDTRFYNAHATACDVLWSGLPLLTCAGNTFASRVGMSLLTAMSVPELICRSLTEYEQLAMNLARNPDRRRAIREKLELTRRESPLFNSRLFANHLEAAYREMWDIYISGDPPRAISVSEP